MNENRADLLIIVPPARIKGTMWPPYGAMYIAGFLRKNGYNAQILNVDTERISNSEVIQRIREINPRYIGWTAMVATSYKYVKELSLQLKESFPEKIQILGGGFSHAAEILLRNTAIDIVVYGEGELTAGELLDCLDNKQDLDKVAGIYYKKDTLPVFTGRRPLIRNLDELPYPAFDLIDMQPYLADGVEFIRVFQKKSDDRRVYDKNRKRKMINIVTNRGCIGSCSFCAKISPGFRAHSIKYIFDFVEYCIKKFDVGFFSFGDDCFAANKARNWEFIAEYKRRRMDIIFRILGLRVDTVDRDILRAYRKIGCYVINYGFESGSQRMLNIIDKRVSVEQNRNAGVWTQREGIFTPPQLILGMPGETDQTVDETIDFLKSLEYLSKEYKMTYALPMPGTHLYDYAKLTGAIDNDDEYLCSLAEIEGTQAFHINLTDQDDAVVKGWRQRINQQMYDHYFYKKYKVTGKIVKKLIHLVEAVELHIRRKDLWQVLTRKLKAYSDKIMNTARLQDSSKKQGPQFRKDRGITIEQFLLNADCSSVNGEMALQKINSTLRQTQAEK